MRTLIAMVAVVMLGMVACDATDPVTEYAPTMTEAEAVALAVDRGFDDPQIMYDPVTGEIIGASQGTLFDSPTEGFVLAAESLDCNLICYDTRHANCHYSPFHYCEWGQYFSDPNGYCECQSWNAEND